MAKKETINEGLFGAAKKFTDAFFDGLKNNATKAMLDKAEKEGVYYDDIVGEKNWHLPLRHATIGWKKSGTGNSR
jgi:hypothetical protein